LVQYQQSELLVLFGLSLAWGRRAIVARLAALLSMLIVVRSSSVSRFYCIPNR